MAYTAREDSGAPMGKADRKMDQKSARAAKIEKDKQSKKNER